MFSQPIFARPDSPAGSQSLSPSRLRRRFIRGRRYKLGAASSGCEIARGSLAFALIYDQFKADLLAFIQGAHASALHCTDVHEDVGASVAGLDKSKALVGVKPFHSTGRHFDFLTRRKTRLFRAARLRC